MAIVSPVSPRCTEPLWRPVRRLNRAGIPEKYLPWLLDPASLTERLIGHCRQQFHVQLLDQRRARPLCSEARAVGMRHGLEVNGGHGLRYASAAERSTPGHAGPAGGSDA